MRKAHPASPGGPFAKTAGTHAKVRYRCFLPDLAGFTSPRRPHHKLSTERVGFEPTIPFRVYTRSRRAPSAARPSLLQAFIAESVGFEPTVPSPVRLISSQVPSTTRPALHCVFNSSLPAKRER